MATTTKKFNPSDYLTDIKGKPYLPVAWRLVWFREDHPDWEISTEIVEQDEAHAIAKATIRNDQGKVLATAHKKEDKLGFGDFLEKAETGSVGRCLALIGYGTQFAPELEEGAERIVDSPITPKITVRVPQPLTEVSQKTTYINTIAGKMLSKAYFATASSMGIDAEKAHDFAVEKFKLASYTDITKEQLQAMIQALNRKRAEKDLEEVVQDLDSLER